VAQKALKVAKRIPSSKGGGLARAVIEQALHAAPDGDINAKAQVRRLLQSTCTEPGTLVGCRVRIFWPGDAEWYPGTISHFDSGHMLHKVDYDDGETYRHDLSEAAWRVVGELNVA